MMHSHESDSIKKITKRLLPLYITAFLHGFVLWYTVEKLFMHTIGFNDTGIGFMVAAYSIVMLILETPSGILADRWSRKGVLILASIALGLASFIGGISSDALTYILCAVLWGAFYSAYVGTYDTIVYDTVYEETKDSKLFERFYGKVKVADSAALVISSLLGGGLAGITTLNMPYFVTIIPSFLAIVFLMKFDEPKLHKAVAHPALFEHIHSTFRIVIKNNIILPIVIVSVLVQTLAYQIYEFNQLWLIALNLPVVLFGVMNAALLSSTGLGGSLVSWLAPHRTKMLQIAPILLIVCTICLALSRNVVIVVIAQTTFATILTGLGVIFSRLLHDQLPSNLRAGASSAVGTIGRLFAIPVVLLFGYISNSFSIFNAAWLLLVLSIVATPLILKYARSD